MKLFRILSHRNCASLGLVLAATAEAALEAFHAEMAPLMLDVYARPA